MQHNTISIIQILNMTKPRINDSGNIPSHNRSAIANSQTLSLSRVLTETIYTISFALTFMAQPPLMTIPSTAATAPIAAAVQRFSAAWTTCRAFGGQGDMQALAADVRKRASPSGSWAVVTGTFAFVRERRCVH